MDEFAQTGAQQDDLFDEIQYDQSMQTRAPDDLFNDEIQPLKEEEIPVPEKAEEPKEQQQVAKVVPEVPAPTDATPAQTGQAPTRGRGGRGRGRGRGRNNQDRNNAEPRPKNGIEQQPAAATAEASKPATNAVRGDRTATGGLRKPKLSEQELAEKMSRISLKNEKLAAAHARAEADAANFAEREEAASKRRQEERRDRQQMMGEREKNRLRKLKAIGGREWDAEKPDDADAFGGSKPAGGRGRGAHGGIAGPRGAGSRKGFGGDKEDYTDGREYMYREDRDRGRGRGRGGRGSSDRGGHGAQQEKQQQQSVPKATDFPDLSGSASAPKFESGPPPAMAFPTKAKVEKVDMDEQLTPGTEKKSWADMME